MNVTQTVLDWIAAHPYQTAFQIVNGVIICTPAAATVPFLAALGFGANGPIAGRSYYDYYHSAPCDGLLSYANTISRLAGGDRHVLFRHCPCEWFVRVVSERSYGWVWSVYCGWGCAGWSSFVFGWGMDVGYEHDW